MMKFILLFIGLLVVNTITAQEIGANFNHHPETIQIEYLKKTPVDWIRTTPYIFEYINGERNVDRDEGLGKVIEAQQQGFKIAFGFRWDFRKYKLRIPAPNSGEEKKYFEVALKLLQRMGPFISIFKLGNEPNLETLPADMQVNEEGIVPLVKFTERLLTEVVEPYYTAHPELKRPDVYTGSIPALFDKKVQENPAVIGLIKMANDYKAIKGLSVHAHIRDSAQMEALFTFVRKLLPAKPLIVPEFSLFQLYNLHRADILGDNKAGLAFVKKYGYQPSMKIYEWYDKVNTEKVTATEFEDMFYSRAWFPQHFMQTFYRYFQKYGVVLATYGYIAAFEPIETNKKENTSTWFINRIYPFTSIQSNPDGTYVGNPLWYDDFVAIVNRGK